MDRTILHCDLNSFFAAVELLDYPQLRGEPVAVCGDPRVRHGIVLAKNEAAKRCGIKTAETVGQAKAKCPNLVLLPAHHQKYRYYSALVNDIYGRFTDLVEPFGIDESWLDVTGTLHLFGETGEGLADRIRATVREELGLTLSVGVSFNKIFAKLGSDYKKPDATTVITRETVSELVWPLPVSDLLFVGRAAKQVLDGYGIHTIGELAACDRAALTAALGKQGAQLHRYATGEEHSPVRPRGVVPPPKSVGNGLTFPKDLVGREAVHTAAALLADQVAVRLRACGMKCSTVQVTIRDPQFHDLCRRMRLDAPTNLARDIARAAEEAVAKNWSPAAPIRALTVTALSLADEADAGEQIDLFRPRAADRRAKLERLERTVDHLRDKFGGGVIRYGAPSEILLGEDGEPDL